MAWISAQEAVGLIGVRMQTLYAYVSRGKIRNRQDKTDPRRRLYHRDDVIRMAGRKRGPRQATIVAEETLEWGVPVLPSAISTIQHGRLWYRGIDAIDLAQTSQLEDIAGLLWETGDEAMNLSAVHSHVVSRRDDAGSIRSGVMAMAERSVTDLPTQGRTIAALREEAQGVLASLVSAMFGADVLRSGGSISAQIATAWKRPDAEPHIRQALCLLADHELNASTFATRVAISTGASLAAGVLSGLATLTGPLHGRAGISLMTLMEQMLKTGVETTVRERLHLGLGFPAFGHPLYPDGDPRATALLGTLAMPPSYENLSRQVELLVGNKPNVDFGLAVLTAAHRLPAHAPLGLFAIGRCVGWLAHALEQAGSGQLIRPRARYVGVPPSGSTSTPLPERMVHAVV
ncbi:Citrate synthase 2 [Castellaniella defragrans]